MHTDADALSRLPNSDPDIDEMYRESLDKISFLLEKASKFERDDHKDVSVSSDSVHAILLSHGVAVDKTRVGSSDSDNFIPAVEQLVTDPSLIRDDILEPRVSQDVELVNWREFQMTDKNISVVIKALEEGQELVVAEHDHADLKIFAREQKKLQLSNGVLYRKVEVEDGQDARWQLVLPVSHRAQALEGVHEGLFHTCFDNAIVQLRMRFFWPFMAKDLERKIKRCFRCVQRGAIQQKSPMNSIVSTFPLELLSIDFFTIECKGQKQDVLVILDHFTKFGAAFCTPDQTAKTVAKTLWQKFFLTYGFPKCILTDQGRDFESLLIKELCRVSGIEKIRTTPYRPSGNPVERWNRTILNMLRGLEERKKEDWRKHLPEVVHAYNCCVHSSTGYSPYFLFFGRHPRLPIDIAFNINLSKSKQTPIQYIKTLKEQLSSAYERARGNMEKTNMRNKARYDRSAHATELEVGDRVLVRKLGARLDSKISDKWERDVYRVVSKKWGLPIYTVRDEKNDGPNCTLHRNYLLPVGMLDANPTEQRIVKNKRNPLTSRTDTHMGKHQDIDEDTVDSGDPVELTVEISRSPGTILRPQAPEFVPRTPSHFVGSDMDWSGDEAPSRVTVSLEQRDNDQDLLLEVPVGDPDSETEDNGQDLTTSPDSDSVSGVDDGLDEQGIITKNSGNWANLVLESFSARVLA